MTEQNKIKILLVDDDRFLLDMYAMKFSGAGFEVTGINDPQEALNKIKDGYTPDIFMFDIVMPGIDGWAFIKSVRDQNLLKDSVAIVLSNQGQQADVETSKQYNVDGYIVKALCTPSEVLEKVQKIYESKHK